jgi:hypothetical protein
VIRVQVLVNDRYNRRVVAQVVRGIVGHDALGLERVPKDMSREMPLIIILVLDGRGPSSVDGNAFNLGRSSGDW